MFIYRLNAGTGVVQYERLVNDVLYLRDEIKVFDHVTLINVPVFPIDVSERTRFGRGVKIRLLKSVFIKHFSYPSNSNRYLHYSEEGKCPLTCCAWGIYVYHTKYKGDEIIKNKVTDFKYALYYKLITKTDEYFIRIFKVERNYWALLLFHTIIGFLH